MLNGIISDISQNNLFIKNLVMNYSHCSNSFRMRPTYTSYENRLTDEEWKETYKNHIQLF